MNINMTDVVFVVVGVVLFGEILLAEWRYARAARARDNPTYATEKERTYVPHR